MTAVLAFVSPPAGLAPLTQFTLNEVSGADGLYSLRAVDNSAIRLFVLDAAIYLPDYSPDYKLVGSETDIRFAFGDAVCVPALKWVVEHSIEQLLPTQGVRNGKSSSLQKHLVFD